MSRMTSDAICLDHPRKFHIFVRASLPALLRSGELGLARARQDIEAERPQDCRQRKFGYLNRRLFAVTHIHI